MEDSNSVAAIKCAIFIPSRRRIWSAVGNDYEYWTDPDIPFCSCADFYFSTMRGGQECYHLRSVRHAASEKIKFELTEFSDEQYPDFVSALARDAEMLLRD